MRATRGGDWWLVGVCVSRILLYATFMVYAACLAVVRIEWGITAAKAALVSSGFAVSYALSLVVFGVVADRFGARRISLWSAALTAVASVLFGVLARSYASALVLYTLVGLMQGGVYTPVIMLIADRYPPEQRGAAVGWLVGSTSFGYAASLVLAGVALHAGGYQLAFQLTGLLPLAGAVILLGVLRTTPNRIQPRAPRVKSGSLLAGNRDATLLTIGYGGHSWEVLGMWAWMPAFLTAVLSTSRGTTLEVADVGAYLSAGLHLLGATAATTMGRLSDHLGRRRVLVGLSAASAAMSFSIGWALATPLWLLLGMAVVYSFTAIGDSPVLSAAMTETVEPSRLGSILGVRSLVGFGAGAVSPWVLGLVLDWSNAGSATPTNWGWAFMTLGLGGALATGCAWLIGGDPASPRPAWPRTRQPPTTR